MAESTYSPGLGQEGGENSRPFGDTSLGVSIGRSIAGLSLSCGVWIFLKAVEGIIGIIR